LVKSLIVQSMVTVMMMIRENIGWIILISGLIFVLSLIALLVIYHERLKPFKEKAKSIKKDDILKDGFSQKKIEELGKFDCIIIGSGMGGLTTGALLSRAGKRVLILEQHDVIGGCTHTFKEKGFEFDTGVHYLGRGVTNSKSSVGFIFHLLGLGNIRWSKMDKVYDRAAISPILSRHLETASQCKVRSVDWSDNFEETKAHLKSLFPTEIAAIDSYFRLVQWSTIAFPLYVALRMIPNWMSVIVESICRPFLSTFFHQTTRQVLETLTKNEELIGVLTYIWGDYGLPPDRSAFVMTGLVLDHFSNGAYYPTGGSSTFAESFLPTILANDGRALVRAPVSHILLNTIGDQAIGVHVRGVDIYAPIIISACGVLQTFTNLISPSQKCLHADQVRRHLFVSSPSKTIEREKLSSFELCHSTEISPPDQVAPSLSMFSLYIGLNGTPQELSLPSRNLWLFADWNHDKMVKENLASTRDLTLAICRGETENLVPALPLVFIGSASAKDDDWTKRYPDKCVLEVLSAADFSCYWEATRFDKSNKPKHRGKVYNNMKMQTEKILLDVVLEQYPHLKNHISFVESGSPLTNNFYLGTLNGEVYGLEHSVARFTKCEWFLKFKTPIKGLYLSGQDSLCEGIVGALSGGVLCAISVDPFVFIDLIATYIMEEM